MEEVQKVQINTMNNNVDMMVHPPFTHFSVFGRDIYDNSTKVKK
jgi:hypothetical protein